MSDKRYERYTEIKKSSDQRTESQRDRDRILYTLSLRRLAGVTQIFSSEEGHVFHNRLTHTIQVAQIARRISEHFIKSYDEKTIKKLGGLDPDTVEAAALIHDLGHPPFGHLAEQTLDELLKKDKIQDGFEGNAQSFRIINFIENRFHDKPGLNLTRATLNASLKYPWCRNSNKKSKKHKKFGCYKTEKKVFDWVRKYSKKEDPCLEAGIMDFSDDLAYSIHDFEDFYRAGFIPVQELLRSHEKYEDQSGESKLFLDYIFKNKDKSFKEHNIRTAYKEILNMFQTYFSMPYKGKPEDQTKLVNFTSKMIGTFVREGIELTNSNGSETIFKIDPNIDVQIFILKKLASYYIIDHPSLRSKQKGQKRVVKELYKTFTKAATKSDFELFPEPYKTLLKESNLNREGKIRIAVDFITGMTELQAILMYKRITGFQLGSALYNIV